MASIFRGARALVPKMVSGQGRLLSTPAQSLKVAPTQVTRLSNGIRVATEEGHGETATVGVYIDCGSRFEDENNNGVAHFLEHMIFKGTSKQSRREIEESFENMGGHLNAFTSREHTVYFAQVGRRDVGKALSTLAGMVQSPLVRAADVEAERGVILTESQETDRIPREYLHDRLHETAYDGCALGRTILGSERNIRSLTRDDILAFVDTHYTAPRFVVAGAGGISHDELCRLTEDLFRDLPSAPRTSGSRSASASASASGSLVTRQPARFVGSDLRVHDDDLPLCHFAIAVEGPAASHADTLPLTVMQAMLGSWDRSVGGGRNLASPLLRAIADERSAHSVSSFLTSYADTSLFGVEAVAEPEKLDDAVNTIQNNLVRLCFAPTEAEVARARQAVKAAYLQGLDGTTSTFLDIGRQLTHYGRRITPAEYFARVDAVDVDTIKRVASKYIYDQNPAVAAVGPIKMLPDYNWIRGGMYWWRA